MKLAQIEFKSDTINYMIFREDSWKGIVYSCIRSRCSTGTSAIHCAIGFVISDSFTLGTSGILIWILKGLIYVVDIFLQYLTALCKIS